MYLTFLCSILLFFIVPMNSYAGDTINTSIGSTAKVVKTASYSTAPNNIVIASKTESKSNSSYNNEFINILMTPGVGLGAFLGSIISSIIALILGWMTIKNKNEENYKELITEKIYTACNELNKLTFLLDKAVNTQKSAEEKNKFKLIETQFDELREFVILNELYLGKDIMKLMYDYLACISHLFLNGSHYKHDPFVLFLILQDIYKKEAYSSKIKQAIITRVKSLKASNVDFSEFLSEQEGDNIWENGTYKASEYIESYRDFYGPSGMSPEEEEYLEEMADKMAEMQKSPEYQKHLEEVAEEMAEIQKSPEYQKHLEEQANELKDLPNLMQRHR